MKNISDLTDALISYLCQKTMLSISGFYDGKTIKPLEKTPKNKKYKVVITFIEEFEDAAQMRDFAAQTDSFTFWKNPKEDIYQDYLRKK